MVIPGHGTVADAIVRSGPVAANVSMPDPVRYPVNKATLQANLTTV
jgi:hypothetical protein